MISFWETLALNKQINKLCGEEEEEEEEITRPGILDTASASLPPSPSVSV